ncbi:MAG: DUF87 domain-containing protein [Epsilonproteobacteria bacterium]|nr:DUF87 domain-containing protein [Campylobacterota bacterium]
MKEIYEKAGLFYVGKDVDKDTQQSTDVLTLLKNKNFTTHAAIIGMTGSGKTGLGIGLIEEAAIDNIPAIIIDPKGDMGNLLLTDPTFSPKSFEPWVKNEAESKNENPKEYAQKISTMWKEGIESWGQDASRVQKFAEVEKNIYTPGSLSGLPINILSFSKPSQEIMQDSDIYASYIKSTANGLLSLIGLSSKGLDSKEYILLAQILSNAWINEEDISLSKLVSQIIEPPFKHIGVLPLDSFYTPEDRFKLATKFNSLLASPDFALWLKGDSLDIQKLLYDENGKAKISIFSIAHLNDEQRMFFVTLLLNQYISWMRRQSGTNALKALLYMDEIYGFFPPSKNPPSKEPMLLLLKQARAFGLGVVLSTQNPVDLDYKGLSNIGTWFIGRLQTSQDIQRVIDGLGTKVGSSYTKKDIKSLLSNLNKRTFFLKSAHLDDIRLFTTRWVLSYLKGPLSKVEISELMADKKESYLTQTTQHIVQENKPVFKEYQSLDESIVQYFEPNIMSKNIYIPTLSIEANVHFYNQTKGIDKTIEYKLSLPLSKDLDSLDWDESLELEDDFTRYPKQPSKDASFSALPEIIVSDKKLKLSKKSCIEYLYHNSKITLYKCKFLKVESKPNEDKADFLVRVQDVANEKKEEELEKLKARYEKRLDSLEDRLQKAQQRVEKEKSDSTSSMLEAGISILGALFGRTTPTKLGRAVSKSSKILKERGDLSRAEQKVADIQSDIEDLEYELEDKIDKLNEKYDIDNLEISEYFIKPKKTNIEIKDSAIVWRVSVL